MRYYNADGGEAEMCGNGARCFARYAARLTGQTEGSLLFLTMAGPITADLLPGERVRLRMSEPHSLQLAHALMIEGQDLEVHSLNTGVPHAVVFVTDLQATPVVPGGAPYATTRALLPPEPMPTLPKSWAPLPWPSAPTSAAWRMKPLPAAPESSPRP